MGQGLFNRPNNSSILGSVPRAKIGIALGTVAQMRVTGQVLGIAAGGAVLANRIPDHARGLAGSLPQPLVKPNALILSVHGAFYVAAAICVVRIFTRPHPGPKDCVPQGQVIGLRKDILGGG